MLAAAFGLGACAMVAIVLLGWLFVIASASTQVSWLLGAAIFLGGILFACRHGDMLAAPWQMWMALWAMMDDWLAEIERK